MLPWGQRTPKSVDWFGRLLPIAKVPNNCVERTRKTAPLTQAVMGGNNNMNDILIGTILGGAISIATTYINNRALKHRQILEEKLSVYKRISQVIFEENKI